MDTQDMALLLVAGILLVAIVVVNTATPTIVATEGVVHSAPVLPPPKAAPRMGMTAMVFVYDPTQTVNAVVEVSK
jgi:hypothetical protein